MEDVEQYKLGWIIYTILEIQFQLSSMGIFIRGGITLKELYTGKNFIYGKGIIDAYHIENKIAIYPRVVIDKELIKFINNQVLGEIDAMSDIVNALGYDINNITESNAIGLHFAIWTMFTNTDLYDSTVGEEKIKLFLDAAVIYNSMFSNCILQDEDGEYYINFMQYTKSSWFINTKHFEEIDKYILCICLHIKREIESNINNKRIINKYKWLLNYLYSWFANSGLDDAEKYTKLITDVLKKLKWTLIRRLITKIRKCLLSLG